MRKAYTIETCTSAPYIENHCDDITPGPQVRSLTHTFHYDITICFTYKQNIPHNYLYNL